MTIIDFNIQVSSLALKEPFITALRSVNSIDEVFITLHTPKYIAYGSAPATLAVTGDDIASIKNDLQNIVKPAFINQKLLTYEESFQKLKQLDICKSAKACIDIALHDLYAQIQNQPLYKFLGGCPRPAQTLYTISVNTKEEMLLQALKVYQQGFKKLKIKLNDNLDENIHRVLLLAERLPQAELYLDINQALNLKETKSLLEAIKHLDIVFLEQPLPAKDLKGMKELTSLQKVPILADESVFTLEDAITCYEEKACNFINIKLMKCGGIYEAKKILDFCRDKKISCMMGCMLEGSISVTAALHLVYAYENIIFTDLDGPTLAKERFIQGGIKYKGMSILLDNTPGLGLCL